VLEAEHLCMAIRGVQKPGSLTVTSALRGVLLEKPEARHEFFDIIRKGASA
jgi:GTP cyclohydrolase I